MRYLFACAFAALLMPACFVELEGPPPQAPERLAVFAFLDCQADSSRLLLSRTFGFESPLPAADSAFRREAVAELLLPGRQPLRFSPEEGSLFFQAAHDPIGDGAQSATLAVYHPAFGWSEASAQAPLPGTLLSARLLKEVSLSSGAILADALEVRILDYAGQPNYYELYLDDGDSTALGEGFWLVNLQQAEADGQTFPLASFSFAGSRLFTDLAAEGAVIRLLFKMDRSIDAFPNPRLNVRYITELHFRYLEHLAWAQANSFVPTAASFEAVSNFSGATLGVFALYHQEQLAVER